MNKSPLFFLGLLLTLLFAACGGGPSEADGGIVVTDVWGRPSPGMATNGAFYMNIRNNGRSADRLVRAESPACGTTELHETTMQGDVMHMGHAGEIRLPPGQTTELRVGGLHVMCLDRQIEFTTGSRIPLTLFFANAGEMAVEAEIREE